VLDETQEQARREIMRRVLEQNATSVDPCTWTKEGFQRLSEMAKKLQSQSQAQGAAVSVETRVWMSLIA
jgi:hypothetical protein